MRNRKPIQNKFAECNKDHPYTKLDLKKGDIVFIHNLRYSKLVDRILVEISKSKSSDKHKRIWMSQSYFSLINKSKLWKKE